MLKRYLLLIGLVLICDVAFGQKATLLADGAKEKDQNKSHVSLEAYDQGLSVIYATNDVKLYITKLRKHLKADDSIEIINIHGKGYKLIAPEVEG